MITLRRRVSGMVESNMPFNFQHGFEHVVFNQYEFQDGFLNTAFNTVVSYQQQLPGDVRSDSWIDRVQMLLLLGTTSNSSTW